MVDSLCVLYYRDEGSDQYRDIVEWVDEEYGWTMRAVPGSPLYEIVFDTEEEAIQFKLTFYCV